MLGLISAFPNDNVYADIASEVDRLNTSEPNPDPDYVEEPILFPAELTALRDNWHRLPLTLDIETAWPEGIEVCNVRYDNLVHAEQTYFNIVTETVFFDSGEQNTVGQRTTDMGGLTFTEKTFKPMLLEHPFILVARPGSLQLLRNYGFQTFGDYWDESYDTITDHVKRIEAIMNLISDLCAKTNSEMDALIAQMQPVLAHNKQVVLSKPLNTATNLTAEQADNLLKVQ